jgi:hypothetical protein
MWRTIQLKANNGRPLQLVLDMKVRWSSTYLMLDRAERKKEVRNKFYRRTVFILCLCSVWMLLLTSFDGKNTTLQNVTRYVN